MNAKRLYMAQLDWDRRAGEYAPDVEVLVSRCDVCGGVVTRKNAGQLGLCVECWQWHCGSAFKLKMSKNMAEAVNKIRPNVPYSFQALYCHLRIDSRTIDALLKRGVLNEVQGPDRIFLSLGESKLKNPALCLSCHGEGSGFPSGTCRECGGTGVAERVHEPATIKFTLGMPRDAFEADTYGDYWY